MYEPADEAVKVSTHSRPKAAGYPLQFNCLILTVSTHSRPKAAGYLVKNYLTN